MTRKLAGKDVHSVGLGCMGLSWAYGTPPSVEEGAKVLHKALDLGYNHLDSARIYGGGKNEELLGNTLKGRRNEFLLVSKCGIVVNGPQRGIDCSPDAIEAAIEKSLTLLQTDHIDLYYMHRFDPKVPIADSVGAMSRAIEAGKIGAYGVSEWNAEHIREAHAVHPMAAVQNEHSLWTRNAELGAMETTRELGIAFVAFSPVARGVLGGVLRDTATLVEGDLRLGHPRFSAENWPKNVELVIQFDALAAEAGVTPCQLALKWALSCGDHVHVIPGTTNQQHLAENFAADAAEVSQDILARANALINQQTVSGHRYPEGMRHTIDTEDFV